MSSVLLLEGPGLSDPDELVHSLGAKGISVERCGLSMDPVPELDGFLSNFALVILRGPWTATFEERLLVVQLGARLKKFLGASLSAERLANGPRFLAIGRGALVALEVGLCPSLGWQDLIWKEAFEEVEAWKTADLVASKSMGGLRGVLHQKYLPAGGAFKTSEPWLKIQGTPVAWHVSKNVTLSFFDPLAYADRTQSPDYGYEDLSATPTQSDILFALLKGEI